MNILHNNGNRFDVVGIHDPGKTGKTGIAGYKGKGCKVIGWILEKVFHKAVSVKTEHGTVYLNCKSFVNWVNRICPDHPYSKKELSKLSHDSLFIKRAIYEIRELHQSSLLIDPSSSEDSPTSSESVQEDPEVPIISTTSGITGKDLLDAREMLLAFKDEELLGDQYDGLEQIVKNFSDLTRWHPESPHGSFRIKLMINPKGSQFNEAYRFGVGVRMEWVEKFHHKDTSREEKKEILLKIAKKMQSVHSEWLKVMEERKREEELNKLTREQIINCPQGSSILTENPPKEPMELLPNLFLGSADAEIEDFTYILFSTNGDLVSCLHNNVSGKQNRTLQSVLYFMEINQKKGKVLIMEQAAMVVVVYLMKKYKISLEQAVNFINFKCPMFPADLEKAKLIKIPPHVLTVDPLVDRPF